MRIRFTVALFSLLFTGCQLLGTEDPVVCTMEARPAVSLNITATPMADEQAQVVVRDGAFADSLTFTLQPVNHIGVAYERAGTYSVSIVRGGAVAWQADDLRVTQNECHVHTIGLSIAL